MQVVSTIANINNRKMTSFFAARICMLHYSVEIVFEIQFIDGFKIDNKGKRSRHSFHRRNCAFLTIFTRTFSRPFHLKVCMRIVDANIDCRRRFHMWVFHLLLLFVITKIFQMLMYCFHHSYWPNKWINTWLGMGKDIEEVAERFCCKWIFVLPQRLSVDSITGKFIIVHLPSCTLSFSRAMGTILLSLATNASKPDMSFISHLLNLKKVIDEMPLTIWFRLYLEENHSIICSVLVNTVQVLLFTVILSKNWETATSVYFWKYSLSLVATYWSN